MPMRKLLDRLGFSIAGANGRARDAADRLIAAGRQAEREHRLEKACQHYREAMRAHPGYASPLVNLGIALEGLAKTQEARAAYESALHVEPRNSYAAYNLGKLLYTLGDLAGAEDRLRLALSTKADFPEALVVLAGVLESKGDLVAALASLDSALALQSDYAGALRNRALLLERLGRAPESEAAWRQAIAADPADARGCSRLGRLLADRGAPEEAAAWFSQALAVNPDEAQAHLGMGNVLANAGQLEQAAGHYRRAAALDPRSVDARVNLGNVLKDQGLREEALQCYDGAIALSPEAPEPRWARLFSLLPAIRAAGEDLAAARSRFSSELAALERWFDDPVRTGAGHAAVGVAQPFWLAYQEQGNRELLARYGGLCARLMQHWQQLQGLAPRAPGPVRVGVVSQFFRNHSVWNAIVKGWFQQLDAQRFALHVFCLGAAEDDQTRYARARAASFLQGAGGLRQWADAILAVQPDVLIYPEIGMDPMSLKLASMRLAPVQAASWGHPETTGLPTIDAYLSALDLEPGGAQSHYTERLVALPNLGCYLEPERVNPAPPDLASLGIEGDAPLLLCPGTPYKYAPEYDRVLVDIVRQLKRCRLVFFEYRTRTLSEALRARLAAAFRSAGLDFDGNVRFIPWQTRQGFYDLLGRADVFLDSIGFSGFNTALQAVQCGLPIVTRESRFLRGRLAGGILQRIGLHELVAADEEQYVSLAVRVVQDRAWREQIRQRIAMGRHLLYEDTAPIRALEAFLAQGV